ncbi:hypothetical protein N7520_011226 [Penicillium odoratum]|uniref:uncharacterized protein n=1 Tax=Penicillium odoratum TaxID=1167516 RepID=UPI002549042C|nr:uncharacterized protein N7520_011226 [Penicillium odoratum]KAJ5746044.1 hypothetical protein N7520_011226 [Penicillium odoratum]
MSNAPESPRRPTSAHASHLQYPTLPPLTASVEEWLSRSRPANSMTSDRLEPLPKSLSDSWATLSVSDLHSEDGSHSEQTDVGSLIDQTTADDVASLDERYSSSEADAPNEDPREDEDEETDEDDEYDDDDELIHTRRSYPCIFNRDAAIDDSNMTTITAHRQSVDYSIEFEEPDKWPEMERVELKHTIRVFEEPAASEIKKQLPYCSPRSILMASVQQTMTKQSLDLDKPFRVLYVGQPDCRNIILDKIGDVLVSSSFAGSQTSSAESSRYHVVPTSFGAGAVPNFAELLPIHVQLVVDECVAATKSHQESGSRTLQLSFKNRPPCQSWWGGNEYHISSSSEWTLPDVAILFVSARDNATAVQTRHAAHIFLERHGVPAMVISDEPLWEKPGEPIPLNQSSLHVCLESRHAHTGETVVLRRYPIDLKTFESITPGQLNRNLASLMEFYPKKTLKVSAETPKPTECYTFDDPEKYPRNWVPPLYAARAPQLGTILRLATLTLVSAIGISLGYAALKTIIFFIMQWVAGSALSRGHTTALTPITPPTLEHTGHTSLSLWSCDSWSLDVTSPGCSHIAEATTHTVPGIGFSEQNDGFEIQVVGDCHVAIKPPHNIGSHKKQPRFDVSVCRNGKALAYELAALFDGVYTLRLDREDAYGLVNVTIVANSKPQLNQTIMVDFGTPWLKIANWRRAARVISSQFSKDLQIAQTGLSEVYGRLSTDLQVIVGDVVKRSHFLRDDAERLHHQSLRTRDSVMSRSKQLSEVIARNAVQQFRSVSSELHSRSVRVNQGARGVLNDAWDRLEKSASQVDLRSMMDRVRSARSSTLDRAQTHARLFMGRQGKESNRKNEDSKR